jgi:hypothetical protein
MRTGIEKLLRASVLAGLLAGPVFYAGFAQESDRTESLILNPPFKIVETRQERRTNYATSGTINDRFELAGVFDVSGVQRFSIHDKQSKKPYWVEIGQVFEGVEVLSYDAMNSGVVLSMGGRTEMISLRDIDNDPRRYNPMGTINSIRASANTSSMKSYPKPPSNLPDPKKLLEQIRKEKAKITQELE